MGPAQHLGSVCSCGHQVPRDVVPLASTLLIAIAPKGQRTAHSAQPVQAAASCSTDCLAPQRPSPCTCNDSTCGAHAATHHPQPVQRAGSTVGRALVGMVMGERYRGLALYLAPCMARRVALLRGMGARAGHAAVASAAKLQPQGRLPRCVCDAGGGIGRAAGRAKGAMLCPQRRAVNPPGAHRRNSRVWGSFFGGAGGRFRAAGRTPCTAASWGRESCSPRWPAAPW